MAEKYYEIVSAGYPFKANIDNVRSAVTEVFRGPDWDKADALTDYALGYFYSLYDQISGSGILSVVRRGDSYSVSAPAYMSPTLCFGMHGDNACEELAKRLKVKLENLNKELIQRRGYGAF